MYPILFKLGPLTIYTYGVFVFLGILAAYFVGLRQAQKYSIEKEKFCDIIFWALLAGFIGARIFFIIVNFSYFLSSPWELIFSRSGFVFYGGIIFGVGAVYFLTKKYKISFLKFCDIIALGLPLGHSIGRLGCFFYGCCYGRTVAGVVIPTQLISALALFLIFLTLMVLKRKKLVPGSLLAFYMIFYGFFRFIIEFFRGDPRSYISLFSVAQVISVIMVIAGVIIVARVSFVNRFHN